MQFSEMHERFVYVLLEPQLPVPKIVATPLIKYHQVDGVVLKLEDIM